jgi:hypothetical protein
MPHRLGSCIALALVASAFACSKDKLEGPAAEVKKADIKVDLPPVPQFDVTVAAKDAPHNVKELRVKGKKLFDQEVTVKGVITFVYDCATAIRQPNESDTDVQKRIDDDPTLCERPKFYIGDTPQTPVEKSLWVVDLPRPWNKLEMQRLKKKDRDSDPEAAVRCEPNEKDPKKQVCPPYAVNDVVTITGKLGLSSPHSERNTDGLIIYKSMKNETKSWESPSPDATAAPGTPGGKTPPATPPAGSKPSPQDLVKNKGKAKSG